MKNKQGFVIVNKKGRIVDGKIWKSKGRANLKISGVIKNNTLKQRKMTGFIGLKVRQIKLNERENKELKKARDFIFR